MRRRRSGRDHFLSADLAPMSEAAQWMDRQRRAWAERLVALADLLEAEDAALAPPTPRKLR